MNIDDFLGYIKYGRIDCVFIFKNYELQLIPNNPDDLITYKINCIFEPVFEKDENGFIADVILEGMRLDGTAVTFCIQSYSWLNKGVPSFKVKWLYFCNNIQQKSIKGISFLSQEINYFYNTRKYIKDDTTFEDNQFKNYTLNIGSIKREKLGSFNTSNYNFKVFGGMAWKKNYDVSNNLEVWSKLSIESSKEIEDLNKLYEIVLLQKRVLNFLTYRTNNIFDSIETYNYNDNKKCIVGKLYINYECNKEDDYKNVKHLITSENIKDIGPLYEMIDTKKIYMDHFSNSHKSKSVYSQTRMLGIMIAFERIVNWKYNKEDLKNSDHLELLRRMEELVIQNKLILCEGLSNHKIKFDKTVSNLFKPQGSFSTYIDKVIKDNHVSKSLVKNVYGKNDKKTIEEASGRINKLRNYMAHGNTDLESEFCEIHTKDLKFMEFLVYMLVLKEMHLKDDVLCNKIGTLFNVKNL